MTLTASWAQRTLSASEGVCGLRVRQTHQFWDRTEKRIGSSALRLRVRSAFCRRTADREAHWSFRQSIPSSGTGDKYRCSPALLQSTRVGAWDKSGQRSDEPQIAVASVHRPSCTSEPPECHGSPVHSQAALLEAAETSSKPRGRGSPPARRIPA